MKCDEIRELISCMLDEELNAEDSAKVTAHLAECPECMRVFEAFHAISISLEQMEEVPEDFTDAVMRKVHTAARSKTNKKKQPRLRMVRMAAMAACLALVLLAGTQFANSPLYTGNGGVDVANFVRTARDGAFTPTPAPTPYTELNDVLPENTPTPDNDIMAISEEDAAADTPQVSATPAPQVTADVTPTPAITPTPVPVVTPTPVPNPVLSMLTDLLIPAESAAPDRFTTSPDMEVTVTDTTGVQHSLALWIDGSRIYCKDLTANTAYYTIGTPDQLAALLGLPVPSPVVVATPAPSASPVPAE